jgi:hypothetical protein
VGVRAFQDCSALKSVVISDDSLLTTLSEGVFCGCGQLESMRIPRRVRKIENSAFWSCEGLAVLEFAEGSQLQEIEFWAFQDCGKLRCVELPEGVRRIGERAYLGCESLQRVRLPAGAILARDAFPEDCEVVRTGSGHAH